MSGLVSDEELRQSPNVEALLSWVDDHRPDCSTFVRELLTECRGDIRSQGSAIVGLVLMGFAAGRKYQHDHPTVCLDGYHR